MLCGGSGDESADKGTVMRLKTILIDLSSCESDELVCHSLNLLTRMHFVEDTLLTHAAHCQLLKAPEVIQTSKEVLSMLPTLRHLLSIDCDVEGMRKIVDLLKELTGYCTWPDEEPHKENQILLYNYGNGQ